MADIRNISLTKKAQSADISNASVTTTVNFPSIVATIPDVATFGVVIETDTRINVDLAGYGEEAIPQPELIKYAQDLAINIDEARKNVGKIFSDTFSNSDIVTNSIKPFKVDTATTIEAFVTVMDYRRIFEEIVDATDDFYGVTNVDDDQTAYVQKRIEETFTRLEEFEKSFGKFLEESFTRFEVVSKLIQPTKLETTLTSEVYQVTMALVKADIANSIEEISKVFARGITLDSTVISDVLTKQVSTVYSDTFIANDTSFIKLFNKGVLDSITSSEALLFNVYKGIAEAIDMSLDEVSKYVQTQFTDLFNTTDLAVKSLSIVKSDLISTSELYRFDIALSKIELLQSIEEISKVFTRGLTIDLVVLSDEPQKGIAPFASDAITTSDLITNFLLNRLVPESFTYLESLIFDVAKINIDTVSILDPISKYFSRPVADDSITVVDSFRKHMFIYVEEFGPYFSEIYTDLQYTANDYVTNPVYARDGITKFEFSKLILELVDATDDFYGIANIDDDQIASIGKVIVDSVTAQETFFRIVTYSRAVPENITNYEQLNFLIAKNILENIVLTETVNKQLSKIFSDSFSKTDIATKLINKVATDNLSYSELYNFIIGKVLVDTTIHTETISKNSNTVFSDTFSQSEISTKLFGKVAVETVTKSDQTIFAIGLFKNESISANETFRKNTDKIIADVTTTSEIFSRVFEAIRSFNESSYISEVFSKSFFKVANELLSISDVVTRAIQPNKVETIYTTEVLSKVTNKVLTDLVDATDDFYGAVNIDDDQTARVDKRVIDYATLTELFSRIATFIRSFTDVAGISEDIRKAISKVFYDQINSSEIVTKTYSKFSTETVSSSQTLSINIQSYFLSDYVESGYIGQTYTY